MYSEKGVPHVYLPDHSVTWCSCKAGRRATGRSGFPGPIANETRAWLDHLALGKPWRARHRVEARRTLEVTLAIERSPRAASGRAAARC